MPKLRLSISPLVPQFGAVMLAIGAAGVAPVHAAGLSAKECHAKFQAAKADKSLGGQSYKAFKASQCAETTPAAATATQSPPAAAGASSASSTAAAAPAKPATTTAEPGPGLASRPTAAATGNTVFPTSVAAQYSKLSAGKSRMKTCLDQYHANKSTGGNGGLKWIQKGGGYYSQCNAKLKG